MYIIHLQARRGSVTDTPNLQAAQHLVPKQPRKLYPPHEHLGRRNLYAERISDPIDDINPTQTYIASTIARSARASARKATTSSDPNDRVRA